MVLFVFFCWMILFCQTLILMIFLFAQFLHGLSSDFFKKFNFFKLEKFLFSLF